MQEHSVKIKNDDPRHAADAFLSGFVGELYRLAGNSNLERRIGSAIVIDQPEQAARVFRDAGTFQKNYGLVSALGDSRFNTNGAEWEHRREATQPAYNATARGGRELVSTIYSEEMSRTEPSGGGLRDALISASLRVFLAALGISAPSAPFTGILADIRTLAADLQYAALAGSSPDSAQLLRREAAALRERLGALVETARIGGADLPDADEFLMNMLAGVDTTAATLSWAIDRMGINVEVQDRIRREVMTGQSVTPYLDAFIFETMRYFPAIPFVTRRAVHEVVLGGIALAPGQIVLISVVGLHHNPLFWREPSRFMATRAEFREGTYDRGAFQPFLSGPRMCGGARLAQIELTEGLKALVTAFIFRRPTAEVEFDYGLALRPRSLENVEVSRL